MEKTILNKENIVEQIKTLPSRIVESFKHENIWGFFVAMGVLIIVSIAFFYPGNIDGKSLGQTDLVQGAANGEEARAYEEATGEKALWTNSLFSGMPTFQIAPEYASNSLFTWIDSVYGLGLPVPSNLLFMMMFGMLIMLTCLRLRWWYALIGAMAWGLSSYFIIIIGAGHIWKFVALSYVPPTIAGFIMIYQGRRIAGAAILALFMMMEINANHPQITYYFSFVMVFLAIGFLVIAIRNHHFKHWVASTGAVVVAGILALGANLPSIYNTYEYAKETKRAESELTPIDNPNAPKSKYAPTGGLPQEEIGGWSNLPEESISLLIPNIKGGASIKPVKGQNKPLALSENDNFDVRMYDSTPTLDDGNGNVQEVNLYGSLTEYFGGKDFTNGPFYVGALIFALFLLGCFVVRGPVKWVLLIASVFSIMLAMGNHFEALTRFMIDYIPLYNKFRAAETALVIAAFCIPTLGILALHKLFTTPNPLSNSRMRLGLSVAIIFPVFICMIAYINPSILGSAITENEMTQINSMVAQINDPGFTAQVEATLKNIETVRYGIVSDDAMRSMIVLLIGGSVIYLYLRKKIGYGIAIAAVGTVILVDMYTVDKRYINSDSFGGSANITSTIQPDQIDRAIMADKGYYRVMDFAAFGNPRRSYFHKMVGGYHAAKLNRYNDLIDRGQFNNPNVLDMLNTKYFIGQGPDGQLMYQENPGAMGPAWLVDEINYVDNADAEMAALETFDPTTQAIADKRFHDLLGDQITGHSEGDYIHLDEYTPNRLTYTVNTRNGGVAVFSEVWFPWGWTATVDGHEVDIARVNYVLRAIRLEPGKHTVVMTFDPASLHVTTGIAYGSVTLIYLLCILALFLIVIKSENKQ